MDPIKIKKYKLQPIAVTQSTNIAKLHWCKFDSTQVHQRAKNIKLEGKRISLGAKTDITELRCCRDTNTKIQY